MEAWNNRKLDYRNKDDILEEMRRLGTSYTPEWYFDEKSDDAGAVIAKIFAAQTAENIRHFNQTLDRYHVEFANLYGVSAPVIAGFKLLIQLRTRMGSNAEWSSLYGVSTGQSLQTIATSKAWIIEKRSKGRK